MKRKIAAILAADIVGYSRLVAEDEEDTLIRLDSYRRVYEDFVVRAGGRIFNTAGDSVLAEFSSAVEATRCAIDIQESIRTRNLGYSPSRQMLFRMGLTIGDVVEREGDLLGDGVNIAARLEGLAPPGGICVSQSVFEQVANKISVPFRDIGHQEVKNIPQPIHAFMVEMRGEGVPPQGSPGRVSALDWHKRGNQGAGLALIVGVLALLAGAGTLAVYVWPFGVRDTGGKQVAAADRPAGIAKDTSASAGAQKTAEGSRPQAGNDPQRPEASNPAAAARISAPPPDKQPKPGTGPAPKFPAGASPASVYAVLSKAGGIVQDASSAPELYHNARVWEARGQAAAARQSYDKLARSGTRAIDVHMRYAVLIRAQDGRAGAREVYGELAESTGNPAVALVYAMQFAGVERRTRIAAVAANHHTFAPVHMVLAREYSADRLGSQTLKDKRQQFEGLKAFLKAREDGALPAYFMDHSVLAAWIAEARQSHVLLEKYFRTAVLKPLANYMRSNQGWMVNLSLPEAAKQISYRIGDSGSFKSTGTFPHLDPRTGQPMANPSFELPPDAGATSLQVRYRDADDNEHGPFALQFEPRQALISGHKNILQRFPNSWLSFGRDDYRNLLYFSHLISYHCAISKAVIALDDGPFDMPLPIPACDMRDPHAVPRDSQVYLKIPQTVHTVRVRLTFADGMQSEEKSFQRR